MGLGGRLVGQMKGLRVVLAGELEHFLAGHVIVPELGGVADLDIVKIFHGSA